MKSIRTKFTVLIVACILVSVMTMQALNFISTQDTLEDDSAKIMQLICQTRADKIDEVCGNVEQAVGTLYELANSRLNSTKDIFSDESEFNQYLDKMTEIAGNVVKNTDGAVSVYHIFNPNVFSSSVGIFKRKNQKTGKFEDVPITDITKYDEDDYAHVGWYYEPIKKGRAIWLQPYLNKNLNVKLVSYVAPIYKNGTTIGVIGMDIGVDFLQKQIRKVTAYKTGYGFLMDQEGNVVYHRDYLEGIKKEKFDDNILKMKVVLEKARKTGKIYSYYWHGVKKKMVAKKLRNGMSLAIAAPVREINAPKWTLLGQSMVVCGVILVIAILIGIQWAATLTKPIRSLTEAAKKIADGDMDVRIECATKDEVHVLAESFRHTAVCLKSYIQHINNLAYMDALTRVGNKMAYSDRMDEIDRRIQDKNEKFCLVVMDINNLKYMNDVFGHEMGDLLIKDASELLATTFGRENVFRIGGDEFVAVLEGAEEKEAAQYLEQLQKNMDAFNESTEKKYESKLQIAYGMCAYEKGVDQAFMDVFRKADEVMYEKKKAQKIKDGTWNNRSYTL